MKKFLTLALVFVIGATCASAQTQKEINKENQENADLYLTPLPQYAEGESVSALKLVRSAGIDPATGKEIYIKRNGEYTFEYDPTDKVLVGDIDADGQVTISDALIIFKYKTNEVTLSSTALKAADTDKNGNVELADALRIFKYKSGEIDSL